MVVEALSDTVPWTTVEYECRGLAHAFVMDRGGAQFTLQLSHRVLSERPLTELEAIAVRAARQVREYETARARERLAGEQGPIEGSGRT